MPLIETLPVREDTAQWDVWGTVARIVVHDPARAASGAPLSDPAHAASARPLSDPACAAGSAAVVDSGLVRAAAGIARAELERIDEACSRFRPDSELNRACAAGGRPVRIGPLLADLVAAALHAAATTGGDVDPTVGAALRDIGYDRDFAAITGRTVAPAVRVFPAPDWRQVRLRENELTVPHGVLLDLGATAKAAAADRIARLISLRLGVGVLVALGGDIATVGPGPDGGWQILVQDRTGEPSCTVRLPSGAALATSSTIGRTWGHMHHIVDPRTGLPAPRVWRTVSVAAPTCLLANTLSTAAIVRGHGALDLLGSAPARLVTAGRDVLRVGGWPA